MHRLDNDGLAVAWHRLGIGIVLVNQGMDWNGTDLIGDLSSSDIH